MLGNGPRALADALDICTAELEQLIDRRFAADRIIVIEPEGTKWTASIGDVVLYRSPDVEAVRRFAATFADRTPSVRAVVFNDTAAVEFSVRVPDNVVPLHAS